VAALAALALHETHRIAVAGPAVSSADLDAFRWIRAHAALLDRFCAAPGTTAALWIPAAAGRGLALPPSGRTAVNDSGRGCEYIYLARPAQGTWASRGEVAFENASVVVRRVSRAFVPAAR
jgi:hypothetical protein